MERQVLNNNKILKCDIAIIGAGPAGISSAINLKKLNPDCEILVIERSEPYNKIGSVIRKNTLNLLGELNVNISNLGQTIRFGEKNELIAINRAKFENGLRSHAKNIGVKILQGSINNICFDNEKICHLFLDHDCHIHAERFVDASGQMGLVPRLLGKRKFQGPNIRASYAYFHSLEPIKTIKNERCENGLIWITPVPLSNDQHTYQILFLTKENVDPVNIFNFVEIFPELKKYGIDKNTKLEDPLCKIESHIRQCAPFIYETKLEQGDNWTVVGDAKSTIFDKIWSGMDGAIEDGLNIQNRLMLDVC